MSAIRFRKRPVVIEAFLWTPERAENNHDWPDWLNLAWQKEIDEAGAFYFHSRSDGVRQYYLATLEGMHTVSLGDWIIRGVKGELYPCKPDIFDMTYEPAGDSRTEEM